MRAVLRVGLAVAVLMGAAGAASAQENLEQGKDGAQLFASDCAICHKSAQALVKEGYPTEGFLRVHYTSGRDMAGALFAYLRQVAKEDAAAPSRTKRGKSRAKAEGEGKKDAGKTGEGKDKKGSSAKTGEAKPPEKKAEKHKHNDKKREQKKQDEKKHEEKSG